MVYFVDHRRPIFLFKELLTLRTFKPFGVVNFITLTSGTFLLIVPFFYKDKKSFLIFQIILKLF